MLAVRHCAALWKHEERSCVSLSTKSSGASRRNIWTNTIKWDLTKILMLRIHLWCIRQGHFISPWQPSWCLNLDLHPGLSDAKTVFFTTAPYCFPIKYKVRGFCPGAVRTRGLGILRKASLEMLCELECWRTSTQSLQGRAKWRCGEGMGWVWQISLSLFSSVL